MKNDLSHRVIVDLFFVLLGCLCLGSSFSAQANDLQIELFTFDLNRNATLAPSIGQLGYVSGSDSLTADFSLAVSWDCESRGFIFKSCNAIKPASFTARIMVKSSTFERVLTEVVVNEESIRWRNAGGVLMSPETQTIDVSVDLSGSEFSAWAAKRFHQQDGTPLFTVSIDVLDEVLESDRGGEANNNREKITADFIPLSGRLDFGSVVTSLDSMGTLKEDFGCGNSSGASANEVNLRLNDSSGNWTVSSDGSWSDAALSIDSFCARYRVNASGDALDLGAVGSVTVPVIQGKLGGFDVSALGNALGASGAAFAGLVVNLPPGHSIHRGFSDDARAPMPIGIPVLGLIENISQGSNGDYSTISASFSAPIPYFLHVEGLPFSIRLAQATLSSASLNGTFDKIHYVYNQAYFPEDRRNLSAQGPISNDRRFSMPSVSQRSPEFSLTALGLSIENIDFDGVENGKTHYPATNATWKASQVTVINGRLADGQVGAKAIYRFEQSTACAGCDSSGGPDPVYSLVGATRDGLAWDGAVMAKIINSQAPAWGPWDGTQARYIFNRPDDALSGKGIYYLPGQIAQGTGASSNGEVVRYLMGSRRGKISGNVFLPTIHYPLQMDSEARKGNYYLAGLTIGPEIYKDSRGLPVAGTGQDISGARMVIGFGGLGGIGSTAPDYQAVIGNIGTKYVLRRGGVTGVFNSDSVPAINVYDYDINLSRFAFRQVNNIVDDSTWIDGSIAIAGKGNFNIDFSSLGLDCSGYFSGGLVPREACDGVNNNGNGLIDENCAQQSFSAWNAEVDIFSIAFVADDETLPGCQSQPRKLQVGNTIALKALSNKLGMMADWSAGGEPGNVQITGSTGHVMDQPKNPASVDDNRGFDIAMNANAVTLKTPKNPDRSSNGWMAVQGEVMTPFWSAVPVSIRLANTTTSSQSQTIVVGKNGYLTAGNSDDEKTNTQLSGLMQQPEAGAVENLAASYIWGTSGFDLTLPIYYEAGRNDNGLQPRFLGRSKNADLKVIEVKSGIDFITAKDTQVSFGASADFENMQLLDLDLHVDLNDAESILKLDKFLCNRLSIPGCPAPVDTLVGDVRDKLNVLNLVSDAGFDGFIEKGLRAGLAKLPLDAPLESVSETIGRVRAIPEELTVEVSVNLQQLANDIVSPLVGPIDSAMLDVYNNLPGLYVKATGTLTASDKAAMESIIGLLSNSEERLNDASNGVLNIQTRLDEVQSMIDGLQLNFAEEYMGQAVTAIQKLQDIINGFQGATCPVNLVDNDILSQVDKISSRVNDVQTALAEIKLVKFASAIATVAGVDMGAIESAQQSIQARVEDIKPRIDKAIAKVTGLCTNPVISAQMSAILNDVKAYLNQLIADVSSVTAGVSAVIENINIPQLKNTLDVTQLQIEAAQSLVNRFRNMTEDAMNGLSFDFKGMTEIDMKSLIDQEMLLLTGNKYRWAYPVSGPYKRTFISEMSSNLRSPIDGFANSLSISIGAELAGLVARLPQPSAEDLRTLIVDKVMNSAVIESIDNLVYQNLSEVVDSLNGISLNVFDQLNQMVQSLIRKVEDRANAMLAGASGAIAGDLPIKSVGVDGYALMTGDELSRLHLAADWTLNGGSDDNSSGFKAALDITSWNSTNKGQGCAVGDSGGLLDARISGSGIPFTLGNSSATIRDLELGFTLKQLVPKGVFGGIAVDGNLKFANFTLYDLAFKAGVGKQESYIGATGSANFDEFQLGVSFLAGKTCNIDVLTDLDPRVGEFIGEYLTGNSFKGVYARGSASMPIYANGCALTVGVSADIGSWISLGTPSVYGGLIGGGGFGKVACIAALRGQVTTLAQKAGDKFSFSGDGFGVAGVGSCSPSTWTSIERSRKDGWCGTGDVSFSATYSNGWTIQTSGPSAIH